MSHTESSDHLLALVDRILAQAEADQADEDEDRLYTQSPELARRCSDTVRPGAR